MTMYMWILTLIAISIIILSLRYTLNVSKEQQKQKGELDSSIPGNVKEHIILKNPVFLTYVSALVLTLLLILFSAIKW